MYCASIGFIVSQFIFADAFYITITNCNGDPIIDDITSNINTENLNSLVNDVLTLDFSNIAQNITTIAHITFIFMQIMTGAYIFQLMQALCVPDLLIAGIILIYIFLLLRAVLGYIKNFG